MTQGGDRPVGCAGRRTLEETVNPGEEPGGLPGGGVS